MTLCVTWKTKGKYSLATDSRLSGLSEDPCDIGIKLYQIPVRIFSAGGQDQAEEIFRDSLGFAFSGSFNTGFLTKERISEVLYNLQIAGGIEDLDFSEIVEIVRITLESSMNQLKSSKIPSSADVFLLGRCPHTRQPKMFQLGLKDSQDVVVEEILEGASFDYRAIGVGEQFFSTLMNDADILSHKPDFAVFKNISNTIKNPASPMVGGNIQYGTLGTVREGQITTKV